MSELKLFFILEGIYLIIALFIILITLFITTREFMPKGALKKGLTLVSITLLMFIFAHFTVTKERMEEVSKAFEGNRTIICENRIYTKGANFIEIHNNGNWKLENLNFFSPYYSRKFFIARCFVK